MKAAVLLMAGLSVLVLSACGNNQPPATATETPVTTETVVKEAETAAQNITEASKAVESVPAGEQTAEQRAGADQQY